MYARVYTLDSFSFCGATGSYLLMKTSCDEGSHLTANHDWEEVRFVIMMRKGMSFIACSFVLCLPAPRGFASTKMPKAVNRNGAGTPTAGLPSCRFAADPEILSPLRWPTEGQHLLLSFLKHWLPPGVLLSLCISSPRSQKRNCKLRLKVNSPLSPTPFKQTNHKYGLEWNPPVNPRCAMMCLRGS